ncbi:hypothetical protein BWQ96_06251 [Gracilariopsis chorda]|uniref:Uncharacterized protein n=1 Tax=Gracilariopsis chorda TaxID=448386 RepID=A0A2V3IPL4_9FLOR|nr:hypothetical protein BWQ96_06251 [Gracilariopsis chorda]|eukprot:PXF44018.1 hypothetical protein BWQ96_06251 [Gracilariopsis chorda]
MFSGRNCFEERVCLRRGNKEEDHLKVDCNREIVGENRRCGCHVYYGLKRSTRGTRSSRRHWICCGGCSFHRRAALVDPNGT